MEMPAPAVIKPTVKKLSISKLTLKTKRAKQEVNIKRMAFNLAISIKFFCRTASS